MEDGFSIIEPLLQRISRARVEDFLSFQNYLFCCCYVLLKLAKNVSIPNLKITLESSQLSYENILGRATAGYSPTFLDNLKEGLMRKPHFFKLKVKVPREKMFPMS